MKSLPNPALTFIVAKDIQRIITNINSYNGAYVRLNRIKKGLGKLKHQGLTVQEFAEWEGLDVTTVMKAIVD